MDDRLGGTVESGGNIRYYGATPNNYIDIGDKDSNGNVILWRIIGVFETKYATDSLPCNTDSDGDLHYDNCASEKLVKIIRDDSIGSIRWDDNNVNDWSKATLNTYLNTSTYHPSLNSNVTSKIENVLWNLGGYSTAQGVYANDFYGYERGTTRYDTSRPTEWIGKIGLMYPSDYGYAADLGQCDKDPYNYDTTSCKGTDWIYNSSINQWTLSPKSSDSIFVFNVNSPGFVGSYNANGTSYGVRPVLYLKSDVSIVGEETTSDGLKYYVVE